MPITTSSYATSSNNTALYTKTEREKVPGSQSFVDMAEFTIALAKERQRIRNGLPIWPQLAMIQLENEFGFRIWFRDLAGATADDRANNSHARYFQAGDVRGEFKTDTNVMTHSMVNPVAGTGVLGNVHLNLSTGVVWLRNPTMWINGSPKGPVQIAAVAEAVLGGEIPVWNTGTDQAFSSFINNATPTHSYTFGTAAVASPATVRSVAIKTISELDSYFNSWADGTQRVKINGEAQTYMYFNNSNHRFTPDSLGMWAVAASPEDWDVKFDSQIESSKPLFLNGTATPWASLPDTLDFNLRTAFLTAHKGQMIGMLNRGPAMISAITPSTSITFTPVGGTTTSNFVQGMMALLPIHSGVIAAGTADSATVIPITADWPLAAAVKVGWSVALMGVGGDIDKLLQMNGDLRITAIDRVANTVTLNQNIPYSGIAGRRLMMWPTITSGQIWSEDEFDIRTKGSRLMIEGDITLFPGFSNASNTDTPKTGSRWDFYNYIRVNHPNAPMGSWAAFWAYSATGSGSASTYELDWLELFYSLTMGPMRYSTGVISPVANMPTKLWTKTTEGYDQDGTGRNRLPFSMQGRHKYQWVYGYDSTNDRVMCWHYIDDVMVRVNQFEWGNTRTIQFAINMSMGWFSRSGIANFQFPFSGASFDHAGIQVHSVKVWNRTTPV